MDTYAQRVPRAFRGQVPKHVPGVGWVWPKPGYEWRDGTVQLKPSYELFEGKPRKVLNADRSGHWRFNDHYDRNGYCDNPGRGY